MDKFYGFIFTKALKPFFLLVVFCVISQIFTMTKDAHAEYQSIVDNPRNCISGSLYEITKSSSMPVKRLNLAENPLYEKKLSRKLTRLRHSNTAEIVGVTSDQETGSKIGYVLTPSDCISGFELSISFIGD